MINHSASKADLNGQPPHYKISYDSDRLDRRDGRYHNCRCLCRRKYRSIFNHFDVIGPKATECGEITQNKGHYAVQGHSRSPTLVLVESPLCDFPLVINTNILSRTVSKLLQIMGKFALSTGGYVFITLVWGEPLKS